MENNAKWMLLILLYWEKKTSAICLSAAVAAVSIRFYYWQWAMNKLTVINDHLYPLNILCVINNAQLSLTFEKWCKADAFICCIKGRKVSALCLSTTAAVSIRFYY